MLPLIGAKFRYYQHDNENKQTSHGSGEAFQPSDVVLGRDYKRCFLALECDLRKPLRANGPISRESLPYPIHADRGAPMTSKLVAELLLDLGGTRSHRRPTVSNDTPYSEAQFKTMK